MSTSIQGLRDAADFIRQASGVDPAFLREAADEIEKLRSQLEYAEFEWDRATEGMKERDAEIERLRADVAEWKQAASVEAGLRREFYEQLVNARAAIVRIDAINDNPARFDKEIDDLCRPFVALMGADRNN